MAKTLKVLPLGGLGEIGMNMMVLQHGKRALIVDCGVKFSDERMPGIDLVLPDFSYVLDPKIDPMAILLTHGHEDHIGALPYLLRQRQIPVYGSAFTMALVKEKLGEHGLLSDTELNLIRDGETVDLDPFGVEFLRVGHPISDAFGLAVDTPEGMVVHTGDFKLDEDPVDGRNTDLKRFKQLGRDGVLLLMSDSTGAATPGLSGSERSVRKDLENEVATSHGWSVVVCFASHIPRIRQVLEIAQKCGRKVCLSGRSMIQNVGLARSLGYLKFPDELLIDSREIASFPRNRIAILSTGTQGEVRSALVRIALDQDKEIRLKERDRVILSSRMIPGNEKAIFSMVNHVYRRGAEVVTADDAHVHVSGHAHRDELEEMLGTVAPRHFLPVHGEYRHLVHHVKIAKETGVAPKNCFLIEDGGILEFTQGAGKRAGSLELTRTAVDGSEMLDASGSVLRDRKNLAITGMVVAVVMFDRKTGELVQDPQLFSRGLGVEEGAEEVLDEAVGALLDTIEKLDEETRTDDHEMQEEIRLCLRRFFSKRIDQKPVILPIVMEV